MHFSPLAHAFIPTRTGSGKNTGRYLWACRCFAPFVYLSIHMYKHTYMLYAQPPTHLPRHTWHTCVYYTLLVYIHPSAHACAHVCIPIAHTYIYPYIHVCRHMYTSHTYSPISPHVCAYCTHSISTPSPYMCTHVRTCYIHICTHLSTYLYITHQPAICLSITGCTESPL